MACWFSGCTRRFEDIDHARTHANSAHASAEAAELPVLSRIPKGLAVCPLCRKTVPTTAAGIRMHGGCAGAAEVNTAYAKKKAAERAHHFAAERARAAADDSAREHLPEYEPFHKFNSWEQWLRYIKPVLRLVFRTAGQSESHVVGTPAHRLLQMLARKVLSQPRFPPQKLKAGARNDKQAQRDERDTVQLALKLLQEGAAGKAQRLLSSLGLAEVNQASMERIAGMFQGATLTRTAAADVGEATARAWGAAPQLRPHTDSTASSDAAEVPPNPTEATGPGDGHVPADDADADAQPATAPPSGDAEPDVSDAAPSGEAGGAQQSADSLPSRPVVEPTAASMYHRDKLADLCIERKDKAADATGWNTKMFLHLIHSLDELEYCALVDILQLIGEGAIDDPGLLRMLRLSRGHLLRKPDDGLRPAASVSWWIQIPSILYLRANADLVRKLVGRGNVAVGVRGGVEALPWAVRMLLEQHPDWCVMSTDCTAAFPSVLREVLKKAGVSLKGLTGNVCMHYGRVGATAVNELEFLAANGDTYTLSIPEGGNTGCAKLPALFCIALQEALREVREHHPDVVILGIMDDNFLLGELRKVLAAYAEMKTVLLEQLGLTFNDTKAGIYPQEVAIDDSDLAEIRRLGLVDEKTQQPLITTGVKVAGSPVGTPEFVAAFLNKRYAKLDKLAGDLERLASDERASFQGLLSLVQQCVATKSTHLARSLPPDSLRTFAQRVDQRIAELCLRTSGLAGAADEDGEQFDDVQLRQARILLCSKLGGLGTPGLTRLLEPAFVGAAALIGPVLAEHAPEVDVTADCPTQRALAAALAVCLSALPEGEEEETADEAEEAGPDAARRPELGADGQPSSSQRSGCQKGGRAGQSSGLTLKELRALSVDTIFSKATPKMQGRFSQLLDVKEQARIIAELTQRAKQSGSHRDVKQLVRFLESARKHASAWIRAPLSERECQLLNGHFRIAVALRLGVNPFRDVLPGQLCTWCDKEVGEDALAHSIECTLNHKGDANRRHQWLQQAFAALAKSIGHGVVYTTPTVLTLFGAGAHEEGYRCAVKARERSLPGGRKETAEQNSRRQVDLGLVGVFSSGDILAVDFTVSDGGGSKPQLPYTPGTFCEQRADEKHDTYHGVNGRFEGIKKGQLVTPSYDAMGGCTKETEEFTLHIIKAVAAASPDVPYAVTARRVRATISCALIRSIAVNALDFRNGKLAAPSRSVGGLSQASGPQVPASQSRRTRTKATRSQSQSQSRSQSSETAQASEAAAPLQRKRARKTSDGPSSSQQARGLLTMALASAARGSLSPDAQDVSARVEGGASAASASEQEDIDMRGLGEAPSPPAGVSQ